MEFNEANGVGESYLFTLSHKRESLLVPRISGNISISRFIVDEATGFLEQRNNQRGRPLAFTIEKKKAILPVLEKFWPNYTKACAAVGISRWTLKNHLALDIRFRERVAEIINCKIDEIESRMYAEALTPRGDKARSFFLKAHRPEIYGGRQRH